MIFCKSYFPRLYNVAVRYVQTKSENVQPLENGKLLCKYLNICDRTAENLIEKQPVISKLNEEDIKRICECLHEIGFSQKVLVEEPVFFGIRPITIKYRHKVLKECGIGNVTSALVAKYLKIVKKTTIGELKKSGYIPVHLNVENKLISYMKQWPTSFTPSTNEEIDKISLYTLRLNILQKYLGCVLYLTNEEFYRHIKTHKNIIHRPLEYISEVLSILQTQILIPNFKIKSNLYLIHADLENLKNILHNFQTLGGMDVRDVINMYPKVAMRNCQIMLEIQKVLEEYQISHEAQQKCFNIYNLGAKTVRERIEEAKTTPEFSVYYNHPKFLNMIYHKNLVTKRLNILNKNNKKCITLNILLGSSTSYQDFVKSSGDKLGKGKDLIFCIYEVLGRKFRKCEIRKIVQRHPFWMYTSLIQVKYMYEQLSMQYTDQDIFENCPILLYPLQKVNDIINTLQKGEYDNMSHEYSNIFHEKLNFNLLNNSQKLSLVLYILERNHHFSGNGVWLTDKYENVEDVIKHR